MVSSQELIRELPKLRRYSRALCGTQNRGDAFVAQILKTISEDPTLISDQHPLDISLFRAFSHRWQSEMVDGFLHEQLTLANEAGVDKSLALITPLARQAFLLSALESFTTDQIAIILDQPLAGVGALIEQARSEIALQTSTTVLIIEDELFIATQLEQIVQELGHAVLYIARTRTDASIGAKKLSDNLLTPGLVLADIQLADGSSGIDAVNDLLERFSAPVIFITAYPERLLTGRAKEPTYLINKPFSPDSLKAMITQALFFRHTETRV